MDLSTARDQIELEQPELTGTPKIQAIKTLRQEHAAAVRRTEQTAQLRAEEAVRKRGLTFQDLCDLVDKGREAGIEPSAVVTADYWLSNRIKNREGYRSKWMEI